MTKLPTITDEVRQAASRIDVQLKPRAELPDDVVESRSREIGEKWGSATHIVRFDAPDYLDRELSIKAAEQGVTKTYLILKALRGAGYRLDDNDLIKDRRRQRGKAA